MLRELGQQTNECMENSFFRKRIYDVYYTSILDGLNTMEPPASIEQVNTEIIKYGEKLKHKHKIQAVRNPSIDLEYMEDPEYCYSWNDYVIRKDLPEVSGYEFISFIQATRNDRSEKSNIFFPHDAWKVMTQEQQNIWIHISKDDRICSTSSGITRFQQKDIRSDHYDGISRKDNNNSSLQIQINHTTQEEAYDDTFQYYNEKDEDPSEESNLIYFEQDNCSKNQKQCPSNIIRLNCSTTRSIVLIVSKNDMFYVMNLKTKVKGKLVANGCTDTNVAAIGNGFVEVLRTERNFALVVFDDDLYKKSTPIGYAVTAVDLTNGNVIYQLNETPLIHLGTNYLISTTQVNDFDIAIHDVAKIHSEKQYFHADNRFILMSFDTFLIHVIIR